MSIHIHTPRESTGRDDRKMLRLNNTREERRIDKESYTKLVIKQQK